MKRFALWVMLFTSLAAMPALAQVPLTMSYQGVLTDNANAPANGLHNFTFTIYTAGGSPVWSETQNSVTVTQGSFYVVLGTFVPLAIPFDQQYYLGISVAATPNPPGPELSPRVTLASSPYSLAPWAISGTDIYRASGQVGIGTTSPAAPLQVGGSVRGVIQINGSPTGNPVLQFNDIRAGGTTWNVYSGSSAIGNLDIVDVTNFNRIGMTITSSALPGTGLGKAGFGRVPLTNALEVEGDASKTTAGGWLANSDARIKTHVNTISGALETLDQVRLVTFDYTAEFRKAHPSVGDRHYVNVIAQEFRNVFPDDVHGSGEKLSDGHEVLQVDTYPLTIYSAAAIQELHRLLSAQDDVIAQLRQELAAQRQVADRLEGRFSALERAVARGANRSATAYTADHVK